MRWEHSVQRLVLASGVLAASVTLICGAPLSAQNKPPVRMKAEGKVLAVSDGIIQMRDEKKQEILTVKIPKDKKVVFVTGQMKPSQLTQGTIVRVIGKLQGALLADPISAITVYRPLESYDHGVLADDPNAVVVTGTVHGFKGDKLIIAAGNRRITATVTEDAVVSIETGDYSVAKAGDPIKLDASKSQNGNITARDVRITLTIPEAKEKPEAKKPETKKREAKGKEKE